MGLTRTSKDLAETRDREQLPITVQYTPLKQMKGRASYQLLVVSPEVRKSRVKKERVWGNRDEGGKKKTKLLLANCHMHYMTVFKHCTTGPQGSLAKFGGQEF